jgi:6-phosphofructokinase
MVRKLGVACLVCIGGDGTLAIANRLYKDGIPIIGVPKTIDNDLRGTDITFGFDSAVCIATQGIDRIHTTAQSGSAFTLEWPGEETSSLSQKSLMI